LSPKKVEETLNPTRDADVEGKCNDDESEIFSYLNP